MCDGSPITNFGRLDQHTLTYTAMIFIAIFTLTYHRPQGQHRHYTTPRLPMPFLLGAAVLYGGTGDIRILYNTWPRYPLLLGNDAFYGGTGDFIYDRVGTATMRTIVGSRFQPLYPADPPICICSRYHVSYCVLLKNLPEFHSQNVR